MATGNATNRVSHSNYGKTECDSCTNYSSRSSTAEEHCCSAAKQCKNECSYHFSEILFHKREI